MIRIRNLVKRFGTRVILKDISFDVRRGEVLGLLGRGGAGKTTAIRVMATVLDPTAGAVEVDDADIPVLPARRGFKARIGYFPDDPFVFDYLTGREMLYFMATLYQVPHEDIASRASYYLRMMDMDRCADNLMRTYSRGMRRKVSLIGSLLHQPLYWFLDEPTEALDPSAVRHLKGLVQRARAQNRSVVVATRDLALAESMCDRILVMDRGAVIFDGGVPELRCRTAAPVSLEDVFLHLAPKQFAAPRAGSR